MDYAADKIKVIREELIFLLSVRILSFIENGFLEFWFPGREYTEILGTKRLYSREHFNPLAGKAICSVDLFYEALCPAGQ
jgi:hypothetical protein